MVCWHRRYNLGDEQPDYSPQEFGWRVMAEDNVIPNDIAPEHVQAWLDKHYIILPLYLYDHSGITMSTGQFTCPWDSGQVGYIYAKLGAEGMDAPSIRACLESEVAVYDQYLRGDVYGFIVEERDAEEYEDDDAGWEHTDSCYGFYGSNPRDNGMAEHMDPETLALAIDAEIEY